ncbi:LacI family DNA-binding transcriptional regulator [Actinomadura sp. LD22]|uniref:LacI family DNA-binding transcriptional regulator n=1 Tax=Actinomadura physcomitrii TaxID=2650748 RepID=A0A6I4MGB9_9ACTN|nr:LacI family DNA-binding transcriptional regulator [Actinomadura physcomitrii]MWA03625.1 LacI family DNA-binding transcriptional regulator [Actinomadura physcomitrii]
MTANPRGGRLTQAEIARIAGVSQATVSLVVNGRDEALTDDTRERVRAAIERTGYVANPIARVLAGGRNKLLGVHTFEKVFPLNGDDFYFPFLLGIEEEAESLGYDLLMFTSSGEQRRIFVDGRSRLNLADGALLLGRTPDMAEVAELARLGYPFVFIGHREIPGQALSYVAADYTDATAAVTRRLLELGHRRLAYLRLDAGGGQPGADRVAGYQLAARSARLGPAATPLWDVSGVDEAGAVLGDALDHGITALLVEQQILAEALAAACAARSVSIPADISVAVLGDTIGVRGSETDWSGFQVPKREMGAAATRLLIDQLEERVSRPHVESIACRPVEGSSIGPVKTPLAGGAAVPEPRRNRSITE